MSTLIIDLKMNNLGSMHRALKECAAGEIVISDDPASLDDADRIILPGNGSFVDAMTYLKINNWIEPLNRAVRDEGVPILGVCAGMQLFADVGMEANQSRGLGWIEGVVERLSPSCKQEKIPHVGWNNVNQSRVDSLMDDVPNGVDFYFVHSYHFIPKNLSVVVATTPHGGDFVSVVRENSIYGVQFHPEKSQHAGFKLLKNFLAIS